MIDFSRTEFFSRDSEHIIEIFGSFLNIGSWCDNLSDFTLNEFSWFWICNLLCNRNFVSMLNEFRNIFIYAVMWNSCHRNWIFCSFVFGSEN